MKKYIVSIAIVALVLAGVAGAASTKTYKTAACIWVQRGHFKHIGDTQSSYYKGNLRNFKQVCIKGLPGPQGAQGVAGPQGDPGTPAPTPQYAEGAVLVDRGKGPAIWATDSTVLGSTLPGLGDTASGTFRFTCRTAPCIVTLEGAATEAGVTVYPRILIYKSDINTGQVSGQCEYGDGADNNGSYEAVGNGTLSPLTVGIGGTFDCGGDQTNPPANGGTATQIDVPAGYYDVFTTFYFKVAS